MIAASELILNPDGSVYHLNLLPHQIATKIITVGDQDRVDEVTKYFDSIEMTTQKREFKTTTGTYQGTRITVISTGIGTDNIDIVFNELDALVNIDLNNRTIKDTITSLDIYRIGTSGSMRADIPLDSYVMSAFAIGLDGLMHFYKRNENIVEQSINTQTQNVLRDMMPGVHPYVASGSRELLAQFADICLAGITVTAAGFYAPQGRTLRLPTMSDTFLDTLKGIQHENTAVTNFEMETAGIYGMASALGHRAISLNAIMANRALGTFSEHGTETIDKLIQLALERVIR